MRTRRTHRPDRARRGLALGVATTLAAGLLLQAHAPAVGGTADDAAAASIPDRVGPPTIKAVGPKQGPSEGGTRVKVTGTGFTHVTRVNFGATAGKRVRVVSSTLLRVTTPAHPAGRVHVRVVASAGTSAKASADHFTFTGWARLKMPLPADAMLPHVAHVDEIDCWRVGACAAAGLYVTKSTENSLALWRLSAGHWRVVKAPTPANRALSPVPLADGISCGTTGVCAVKGVYAAHIGGSDVRIAVMWTLSGTTWTAQNLPLPADADAEPGSDARIDEVACGGSQCAAIGSYARVDPKGVFLTPVFWTRPTNSWQVTKAPLPPDVITASDPVAQLNALDCEASGACAALGTYLGGSPIRSQGALWTLAGNTWTVTEAAAPGPDFNAVLHLGFFITGPQMSCGAGGTCAGTIEFTELGVPSSDRFVLYTWSGTAWSRPDLPMPGGAATASSASTVRQVSCVSQGRCAAAGPYVDTGGDSQEAFWSLAGGTWSVARATFPPNVAQNPRPQVTDLVCSAAFTCVANGSYIAHVLGSDVGGNLVWARAGGHWGVGKPFLANPQNQFFAGIGCEADDCVVTGLIRSIPKVVTLSNAWHTFRLLPRGASDLRVGCGPAGGCAVSGDFAPRTTFLRDVTSWVLIK